MVKRKKTEPQIVFPANLVRPVGVFLRSQLEELRKRRRNIRGEDPFNTLGRDTDTSSPDADAEEQFVHDRSSAISGEIDRKIIQTKKALARLRVGKYGICTSCGDMIDTDRLMIYPEATFCVKCEKKKERK